MSMQDEVHSDLKAEVEKSQEAFKRELAKLRTGRANVAILDGVRVNYYGTSTPLNQCATLGAADARLIIVKPFDKSIIGDIEKAILQADVGITPQNDGEMIRLPIPQLNEERRRELVKQAKHRAEEARIGVRNHRRESNEMLKDLEKEKEISQDDLKRALEKVQEATNAGIAKLDEILGQKEQEILEI